MSIHGRNRRYRYRVGIGRAIEIGNDRALGFGDIDEPDHISRHPWGR
jgi:hypothetical protein